MAKAGRHADAAREWKLLVSDLSDAQGVLNADALYMRSELA